MAGRKGPELYLWPHIKAKKHHGALGDVVAQGIVERAALLAGIQSQRCNACGVAPRVDGLHDAAGVTAASVRRLRVHVVDEGQPAGRIARAGRPRQDCDSAAGGDFSARLSLLRPLSALGSPIRDPSAPAGPCCAGDPRELMRPRLVNHSLGIARTMAPSPTKSATATTARAGSRRFLVVACG